MASFIHVSAWERESLWRRILCAIMRVAVLFAALAALIDVLGPPITIFFTARWEAMKIPAIKVTPRPLADYSEAQSPGKKLSYFGYEFEVPWIASYREKAFRKDGLVQLEFGSGQNMTLIVPAIQSGLLTEIVKDQELQMKGLRPVFGNLLNRSAYEQYSVLLSTTPSSIRAFGPRAEAVRGVTLLRIKGIAVAPGLASGAFSFEFGDKRGFQIGDPAKFRRVDLEIFGMGDHYIEIICATTNDNIRLIQPEINRILNTLRRVPSEMPASSAANAIQSHD